MNKKALMPISSVLGALLLVLVVGVFAASPFGEREVAHAQTGPTLSDLTLTIPDTSLSPSFDAATRSYTARVANATSQITVTATAAGDSSMLGAITPADAVSGGAHQVDLSVGTTTIRIPVTEGGSSNTYTVRVTRVSATASNDTKLSSLSLSNVMLSPAFDSDRRTGYTDRVPNSVSLTTVRARAANSGAMVNIESDSVTDSANVVTLTAGATTTITITVTAADVATEGSYMVVVTRAGMDAEDDATLSNLELSGVALSPTFSSSKTAYTDSVPYTTRNTTVTAPATDTAGAMVMITSDMDDDLGDNDNEVGLEVGANVITIKVDAADAIATKTYTVTVTRASATASADANLSSLSLSRVMLSPAFDPGEMEYTALVPNSVGLTTLRATAADSGAVFDIAAVHGSSGDRVIDSANVVTLSDTETTTITITVTAANGVTTKEYMVVVTRAGMDAEDDATLSNLELSGVALSPTFSSSKTAYTDSVPYTTRNTTVTAPATDTAGAMVMITSDMDDDLGDNDNEVGLEVGANVITIKVDAADAIATKTYTVTVTRASATASADANLSSLSLSRVMLSPAFDPGEMEYTALVPNSVGLTTLRASTADSGAVFDIAAVHGSSGDRVIDSANVVTLSDTETTTITITVTAADAVATKTYMVVVTRAAVNASDNASLASNDTPDIFGLRLETGPGITPAITDDLYLNMPFIPSRTDYTTTAERGQSSIIVATTPVTGARVMVSSNRDDEVKDHTPDGTVVPNAFDVDLEPGINVITIKVTAENAVSMRTYTVTVTRTGVVVSSDATLQALTLSGITLSPAFNSATMMYTAEVEDIETTMVEAMATHPGATVEGTGMRTLTVGENVISVTVTAEDETTETYTVTVTVMGAGTLLDRYDANDNNQIDKGEVLTAIEDFLIHKTTTKEEVLDLILLYLAR